MARGRSSRRRSRENHRRFDQASAAQTSPRLDASASTPRRAWRWLLIAALICLVLTLAIGIAVGARAFAWSDLGPFIDRMAALRGSPLAMLAMLGAFVVGGLVVFPINILIAASIVVFGPLAGAAIALLGSVASGALLHLIGRSFPEHVWTRFAGRHAEHLRERVARHGVIAVAIVRVLPIAPYSIVSVAAGVVDIARTPYLVGTALGMVPGIALYALFVDRARALIADPRPLSWAMLLFAVVLIVAVALLLRQLKRRADRRRAEQSA